MKIKKQMDLMVPPNDFSSEVYVLGTVMMYGKKATEVDGITSDMFYSDKNKMIWDCYQDLKKSNIPIDIITVTKYFKDRNSIDSIGIEYILKIGDYAGSHMSLAHHVSVVQDAYIRRKMIVNAYDTINKMHDQTLPVTNVFDELSRSMSECTDIIHGSRNVSFESMVNEEYKKIEESALNEIKVSGVDTGNYKFNSITGGWQKTDLVILAGRPGSGKTTRVINFAAHAATTGKSVAIFSLEMSARQYIRKMLNDMTGVWIKRMNSGDLNRYDLDKLLKSADELAKKSIFLDDRAAVSPSYIKSKLWNIKRNKGLDLVVVDYLQLMAPDFRGHSRDADVGSISMGLKAIAKELDVPVIALSQLSRKCEERVDKRPVLSDLRESGSIEQDADMVLAMYRPSYYYSLDKDRDYNDTVTDSDYYRRLSELHILKHRNGEADTFLTEFFFGELSRFTEDYEQHKPDQPDIISTDAPF